MFSDRKALKDFLDDPPVDLSSLDNDETLDPENLRCKFVPNEMQLLLDVCRLTVKGICFFFVACIHLKMISFVAKTIS